MQGANPDCRIVIGDRELRTVETVSAGMREVSVYGSHSGLTGTAFGA